MYSVLLSKIIPPDTSQYYMRRATITKKLSKIEQAKLTILHSGAGFGKTSALAQFVSDNDRHLFSWYQVTEEDDGVLPFFRNLFYSIQHVAPKFGQSIFGWDHFSMFPKIEELNRMYTLFINEFYKIKQPLYIVIDDFHLVHHVFQINYVLNKIIEHLPSHVHIIVASRIYPTWNCLLSLKAKGQLIECVKEDFVFSNEEIQVLFEDYFGRFLSPEEIEKILTVTEGWAIGILLLAMQSNDSSLSIEDITNYSLKDFFTYLSEEVFDNMAKEEQDVLLKCSIFQSFSLSLIEKFYNEQTAKTLEQLVNKHGFIQPLKGRTEFRLHALFQQFLEIKLREQDEAGYLFLHEKATQFYMMENEAVHAIYHAYKTKDDWFIADVLVRFAEHFIKAGQFDYFVERLKEIVEEAKIHYYSLFYYEGECQRFRAQYEKAKQAYDQCLLYAKEQNDELYVLKANAGLAHIYLDTIQPALAQEYLMEALTLSERVELKEEELQLLQRQFAENLVNLGKASEAEQWVKAKEIPTDILMHGNLDVRILLRQGKLHEAKRLIQLRSGRHSLTPAAHRESDVLHSLILSFMGENIAAYEYASTCVLNSKRDHTQYGEAVAHLRKGHALLLIHPFQLEFAENSYKKTISLMDEIQVTRAKAESFMGLSIVKARQGFFNEAIHYAKVGLYETERVQDRWVSALLFTALTIIYFENNEEIKALKNAKKAKQLFKQCDDQYGEMVTQFWISLIAYKTNDEELFKEAFSKFMNLCFANDYVFFYQRKTLLGPRSLSVFFQLVKYATTLFHDESMNSIKKTYQLIESQTVPKYTIALQLFGPFSMCRNWELIDEKEWKREKAKELFLYLYLHRNRFVSKEELMNVLWPNGEMNAMNRDFKVVYNACLKVLQPERKAREESGYILRKQSMYRLIENHTFLSDVDYYLMFTNKGLDEKNPLLANDWLLLAQSLYKGELLEDFVHIDWLSGKREEYRKQYILLLERLAQNNIRLKQFNEAIQWAERLIEQDATWEEGYRLLMLSYYHLNNRPQAIKWYEKCVQVLQDEFAIEPMETTTQIYDMIVR